MKVDSESSLRALKDEEDLVGVMAVMLCDGSELQRAFIAATMRGWPVLRHLIFWLGGVSFELERALHKTHGAPMNGRSSPKGSLREAKHLKSSGDTSPLPLVH